MRSSDWILRGGEVIACIVGPVLGEDVPWHLVEGEAFADAVYDASNNLFQNGMS